MENKIYYVSSAEMDKYKRELEKDNSLFMVELDGGRIQQLQDYLAAMTEVFKFPIPSRSLDSYNDWMCDLEWIEKDGYVIIIQNYKDFLSQDSSSKKTVLDSFANLILPWWQEEVERCVIEGKVKAFNLYLVD